MVPGFWIGETKLEYAVPKTSFPQFAKITVMARADSSLHTSTVSWQLIINRNSMFEIPNFTRGLYSANFLQHFVFD